MKGFLFILICITGIVRSQTVTVEFNFKSNDLQLSTARFYISNISVSDESGNQIDYKKAYLIDEENEESKLILMDSDSLQVSKISFLIGTDSLVNTSGVLDGDLDPIKGMYWAWNTGYINFKLEGKTEKNEAFEYHVGGYRSPFETVREFEVLIDTNNLKIEVDLDKFISEATPKYHSLMIPGKEAVELADLFVKCFHVKP